MSAEGGFGKSQQWYFSGAKRNLKRIMGQKPIVCMLYVHMFVLNMTKGNPL